MDPVLSTIQAFLRTILGGSCFAYAPRSMTGNVYPWSLDEGRQLFLVLVHNLLARASCSRRVPEPRRQSLVSHFAGRP
jgi:hypothetical protein